MKFTPIDVAKFLEIFPSLPKMTSCNSIPTLPVIKWIETDEDIDYLSYDAEVMDNISKVRSWLVKDKVYYIHNNEKDITWISKEKIGDVSVGLATVKVTYDVSLECLAVIIGG